MPNVYMSLPLWRSRAELPSRAPFMLICAVCRDFIDFNAHRICLWWHVVTESRENVGDPVGSIRDGAIRGMQLDRTAAPAMVQ